MDYADRARAAVTWFRQAYRLHAAGRTEAAVAAYWRSIALFRTAEAHTFLGWALSVQGRFEEAIRECRRAIEIDPDYGNPYNDIGVYLVHLGQDGAAIGWLRRAKLAPRYANRCYPFFNLGVIYERRGRFGEARREYQRAVRLDPEHELARSALARVSRRLDVTRPGPG